MASIQFHRTPQRSLIDTDDPGVLGQIAENERHLSCEVSELDALMADLPSVPTHAVPPTPMPADMADVQVRRKQLVPAYVAWRAHKLGLSSAQTLHLDAIAKLVSETTAAKPTLDALISAVAKGQPITLESPHLEGCLVGSAKLIVELVKVANDLSGVARPVDCSAQQASAVPVKEAPAATTVEDFDMDARYAIDALSLRLKDVKSARIREHRRGLKRDICECLKKCATRGSAASLRAFGDAMTSYISHMEPVKINGCTKTMLDNLRGYVTALAFIKEPSQECLDKITTPAVQNYNQGNNHIQKLRPSVYYALQRYLDNRTADEMRLLKERLGVTGLTVTQADVSRFIESVRRHDEATAFLNWELMNGTSPYAGWDYGVENRI